MAVAGVLDRRRPLRLMFGSGGSFVEEADVDHGMMQFGRRRLYRVGLLNRYTKTVEDAQVRLISREPGQGADMGRRFKEKDTGALRFSVERGSGPTRYVDFVWHVTGGEWDGHFAWAYEVPAGYANVTPAKDYHG